MKRLPLSGWLSQGVPPQRQAAVWLNRGVMSRARALEVGMPTVVFPIRPTDKDYNVIIGVDPHKLSHTATAVDPLTNTAVASLRIDASPAGYRELVRWARQLPERRWAIENAKGLGCHLAQWLLARDEVALDVATTATSRVRERDCPINGVTGLA